MAASKKIKVVSSPKFLYRVTGFADDYVHGLKGCGLSNETLKIIYNKRNTLILNTLRKFDKTVDNFKFMLSADFDFNSFYIATSLTLEQLTNLMIIAERIPLQPRVNWDWIENKEVTAI